MKQVSFQMLMELQTAITYIQTELARDDNDKVRTVATYRAMLHNRTKTLSYEPEMDYARGYMVCALE